MMCSRRAFRQIFFTLLVFTTLVAGPVSGQHWDGIKIIDTEFQALQAFKQALDDPRGFLRSWNSTGLGACSGSWAGIKCVRGKVIAIQFPWRGLGGRITDKIIQFTSLRRLNLHDNAIGGQIPAALGFLPRLRGLYLFNNQFTGTVPPSLGTYRLLQTIDLSNNRLTGSIPSSISNSTNLYRLNLSYNNLSGSIPISITRSPSLTFLALQRNHLSGPIPGTWGGGEGNQSYQLQSLNLDDNHITGIIPASLGGLQSLRLVSLSNNQLNGSIPEELRALQNLQTLQLSRNSIGGLIPEFIGGLEKLATLSLKGNQFSGEIPAMLGNISGLSQLDLSDNNLTGEIPTSLDRLTNLTAFNVSDNRLSGAVPPRLSERFNSSSFRGNLQLCGYSTSTTPCPNIRPLSPPVVHHRRRLSTRNIILIICGSALVLLLLLSLCCALFCCFIRKKATLSQKSKAAAGEAEGGDASGETGGKLVHFEGTMSFAADDLLCATAEIMGKSTYGTMYKTTFGDGSEVVVKRLREKIAKGRREFESEVNVLGRIRHPNLLALRAYYLGPKGEKLLVFDLMPKGSLAAFLHARGAETPINWPTRMKIAIGAARGLSYLHNEMDMIHGNLNSSNILLDENNNAKISDYGLSNLMNPAANSNVVATASAVGYRAPELSKIVKPGAKTDLYSFGVVILELLTGKSPRESMSGMDLPEWVASIVKEEWTNEVFDVELTKDEAVGDELLGTLKLALHCVDPSPAARPEIQQVLEQLEEIRPELAIMAVLTAGDEGGSVVAEHTSTSTS